MRQGKFKLEQGEYGYHERKYSKEKLKKIKQGIGTKQGQLMKRA